MRGSGIFPRFSVLSRRLVAAPILGLEDHGAASVAAGGIGMVSGLTVFPTLCGAWKWRCRDGDSRCGS